MGGWDWTKVGGVPWIGTAINGVQSVYHSGAALRSVIDDDEVGAKEHAGKEGWHFLKSIPFVGTGLTAAEWWHDNDPDSAAQTDPRCEIDSQYTRASDGHEICTDRYTGEEIDYGPRDERTLVEKYTDALIPEPAEARGAGGAGGAPNDGSGGAGGADGVVFDGGGNGAGGADGVVFDGGAAGGG